MLMLSSVLVDEATPLHVRNAAGLALKNALTARVRVPRTRLTYPRAHIVSRSQESSRQNEMITRWLSLNNETKTKIKQDALMTLGSSNAKAGAFASQVVSAIAAVELPQSHWPELIEILLGFVNNQSNANLRISTLQTIGYICEAIVSVLSHVLGFSALMPVVSRNLRS